VLSGYNPEDFDRVLRWPLRDALLAFENVLREQAAVEYRHASLLYAVMAPHLKKGKLKAPKVPKILRGDA